VPAGLLEEVADCFVHDLLAHQQLRVLVAARCRAMCTVRDAVLKAAVLLEDV
jgi:hypothetical protein